MVVSEAMKRNLFLLPGIALLAWVLLADSCSARRSITPAPDFDFGTAKAAVLQGALNSPAVAAAEAPASKPTRMLAVGGQTPEAR